MERSQVVENLMRFVGAGRGIENGKSHQFEGVNMFAGALIFGGEGSA